MQNRQNYHRYGVIIGTPNVKVMKYKAANSSTALAEYEANIHFVFKQGDIDGNGDIDSIDAAKLLKHISKTAVITDNGVLDRADMDYNGEVDMRDVILILQK